MIQYDSFILKFMRIVISKYLIIINLVNRNIGLVGLCSLPCILVTETCQKQKEDDKESMDILQLIESISTHPGNKNV